MGSIPHGAALLAQGVAAPFTGPPTLGPNHGTNGVKPAFSLFPSFNSTPCPVTQPPGPIFAGGSSEFVSAQSTGRGGFSQYTLSNATGETNPRTPFGNVPPILPPAITQSLVNDPITFIQDNVLQLDAEGHSFEGTVLNIATQTPIRFGTQPNRATPTTAVEIPAGGGAIGNIPFLQKNASTALTYATFWITRVSHPQRRPFLQLHYAQMVLLNFPALLIPGSPVFSWPHVSVASLTKTF
jgi:hypothetical protein